MGGRASYEFRAEPMIIDGVHTKKLVIESAGAVFVRKRCEMHNGPRILLYDIAAQLMAWRRLFFFPREK